METLTKNFDFNEFESHDGAKMPESVRKNIRELAKNLEVLRKYFNEPIHINSGYRSDKHNRLIGGKPKSKHLIGQAADIVVNGKKPSEVADAIEKLISQGKMKQGGLGRYNTFTHYDIRGYKARWKG
ncbi:YcbK family protein [Ornithobacterium rhinotracheale]|uniref:YcbK family protein n=1 Tax=Ornithobacterium rhinotracheale TaxID=28251 RepID=UPI001FF54F24|nr:D-Ala-D-Ala carboxypeptidase family metallohydrolase [Ornithobacterium rhinotracheale]MCK0199121.1 D-Ala-D-Ala carboxypeptidase family metallohydrolase [Ornithobacterium rhinotracheale]